MSRNIPCSNGVQICPNSRDDANGAQTEHKEGIRDENIMSSLFVPFGVTVQAMDSRNGECERDSVSNG